MPPDSRGIDRTVHYTMKTSRPSALSSHSRTHSHSHGRSQSHSRSHSQTNSPAFRSSKTGSTPMASPRMPQSVGQNYPPKLSPSTVSRVSNQAQDPRSSSPNYFGLAVEPSVDSRDSPAMPRDNWSPPTSSVKSFAAAIPKQLPLDANPEFEAFRRQVDANRGVDGFALGSSHFVKSGTSTSHPQGNAGPASLMRPRPPRWHTHGSDTGSEMSISRSSGLTMSAAKPRDSRDPLANRMDIDTDNNSLHDSAYVSADSKRNSEASLNPPSFLNMPRHESPAQFDSPFETRTIPSKVEDRHPRLSIMQGKVDPPSVEPGKEKVPRALTVPAANLDAGGPSMMSPAQLRAIIESSSKDELLLLDVRVATHFSVSRVVGALNLCIPTTLLKRATFNLQKLQLTFHDHEAQEKFASWCDTKHIVVYDSSSTEKRDAVAPMNMLKKFTNEGYSGNACVLRGGFHGFSTAYPQLVDHRSSAELSSSPSLSLSSDAPRGPSIPPIIGGVALPAASNNPNPFFSNIRQNMDLADGVGQMDISVPEKLDANRLPRWLRAAGDSSDRGKKVSDRFLSIERAEQSRMKQAYSVVNPAEKKAQDDFNIQLSGIEKGVKNRYKDILPFEHARVRLQGRPEGACDYVNASHIKATRSHKRYIASQGPLPATFEDFWSVIWDQDVRVIVMLTAESEGGQLKCHPYWTSREFGSLRLRSLSEKKVSLDIDKHRSNSTISSISSGSNSSNTTPQPGSSTADMGRRRANTTTTLEGSTPTPVQPSLSSNHGHGDVPYVIIRKFALSHNEHPFAPIREITHLHYPSWPDFGAPAQPSHLLGLVELANVMQRAALPLDVPSAISSASDHGHLSRSASSLSSTGTLGADTPSTTWHDEPESNPSVRPMLVHCSAGCGRTGAFCTVDSVIDMLKRQRMRALKGTAAAVATTERANRSSGREIIDADGDVSMGGSPLSEDAISPLTHLQSPLNFPIETGNGLPAPTLDSIETHPSAGTGKLDLEYLEDDTIDLIAKTVEGFRTQRLSMVQSLRQFVLCYETIIEWVWRLQERAAASAGGPGRGRARSGSLQLQKTIS